MLLAQCGRFLPARLIVGRARRFAAVSCGVALLNEQQDRAVRTSEKCVRVVAGPGSGKTLVLTHRIVHEIKHNAVNPANILCITFTNKAAQEIRERIGSLVGIDAAKKMTISTFHSFCAKVLKQVLPDVKPESGLSRSFVIYDEADCEKILKEIYVKVAEQHLSECKGGAPRGPLHHLGSLKISNEVATDKHPVKCRVPAEDLKRGLFLVRLAKSWKLDTFISTKRHRNFPTRPRHLTDDVEKLLDLFQQRLRANNAADFDDLIYLTIMELHRTPSTRKKLEERWSCILVDEFQDTDKAQYELIRLLCSENQNLFVVGDIDQAIYGWRGAESRNMQYLLGNDFPRIATFQLRKNYRSSKAILSAASRIIENSQINRRIGQLEALKLTSIKPWTAPVKVCWLSDPDAESRFVAEEILRTRKDNRWSDCAVLYRTNRQSFLVESALVKANIPYRLLGATPLFSHKVIKDLLSYLKLILSSDDDLALARIINTPPRGIGEKTIFCLKEWASRCDLSLPKALLRFKKDAPGPKELGITPRARTAIMRFCELLESLTELSERESVAEILRALIDQTQFLKYAESQSEDQRTFEKRLQLVQEFVESAVAAEAKHGRGRSALANFLEDVMLIAEATGGDEERAQVGLLTLHASKGMEFPCVFIIGVNEGTIPHENAEPEEERRLLYVGITRAKDQLYLTHTHGYGSNDDESFQGGILRREHRMSAFLEEIIASERVELFPKFWTGKFD